MGRGRLGVERGGAVASGVLDRSQRRPAAPQRELDRPAVARLVPEAGQRRVHDGGADEAGLQVVDGDAGERRIGPPSGVPQRVRLTRLEAEERGLRELGQQPGPDQIVRREPFGQPYGVRVRGPGRLEVAGRGLLRVRRRDRHRIVRRAALGLGGELVADLVRQPVVLEALRQRALGQPQVQHPAGPPRIPLVPHVERVLQDCHRGHRAVPAALGPGGAQECGRRGQPTGRILPGVGDMPLGIRCPPRLTARQQAVHSCSYL